MERKQKLKKRFYAFYIDLVAVTLMQKVLVYTYQRSISELFPSLSNGLKSSLVNNTWKITLSTLTFTFFSYFILSIYLSEGKTFGKSLLGLRVYSPENTAPSVYEAFYRTLMYTGCYLTGSFLLLIPFAKKDAKGLPDMFSHTEVLTDEEFELKLQQVEHIEASQLDLFKKAS